MTEKKERPWCHCDPEGACRGQHLSECDEQAAVIRELERVAEESGAWCREATRAQAAAVERYEELQVARAILSKAREGLEAREVVAGLMDVEWGQYNELEASADVPLKRLMAARAFLAKLAARGNGS